MYYASTCVFIMALMSLFIPGSQTIRDGVIVRTSSQSVVTAEYKNGKEQVKEFRIGDPQALYVSGRKICVTGYEHEIQRHFTDSCDVLVVTTGKKSLKELQTFFRPRQVALHPALRSDVADNLRKEARDLSVTLHELSDYPIRLLDE